MDPIDPTDTRRLSAAEGWLELGNAFEARAEWDALSPVAQEQPAALDLRWQILARIGDWTEAAQVAERLVLRAPDLSAGWLHRSYAVRRAPHGGLQQAWNVLLPAAQKFPKDETVAYNLACYATQLGRPEDGWSWFLKALDITQDSSRLRAMALRDGDLRPLWDQIRDLLKGPRPESAG